MSDALTDARLAIALEEEARQADALTVQAWRRVWRAVMLSPSLEVCEALLRGERVPLDRLDPDWVRRFGLRRAAA